MKIIRNVLDIGETVTELIAYEERKFTEKIEEHNRYGTLGEECLDKLKEDLTNVTTPLYHIRAKIMECETISVEMSVEEYERFIATS